MGRCRGRHTANGSSILFPAPVDALVASTQVIQCFLKHWFYAKFAASSTKACATCSAFPRAQGWPPGPKEVDRHRTGSLLGTY